MHCQGVTEALEANSAALSQILGKALSAFRAAEAAKKARELVRLGYPSHTVACRQARASRIPMLWPFPVVAACMHGNVGQILHPKAD